MEDVYQKILESRVTVLSGAGLSTDSGIPDYRGPTGQKRQGKPLTFKQFMSGPDTRRHYWARSALGWPLIETVRPNTGHQVVAELENQGIVLGVITQNVDGLHHRAGSHDVVELHGTLFRCYCLSCKTFYERREIQRQMIAENSSWLDQHANYNADGDAYLTPEATEHFHQPFCRACGGALKPDLVFFGENVPSGRVERSYQMVEDAELLLVLGSSLTVRSGLRFVDRAAKRGIPVIIVNQGETRGDDVATQKIEEPLSQWLSGLAEARGIFR